jgi:U2-associated protein SR140
MAITSVWETWMIFNNNNVESWVKRFLGRTEEEEQTSEESVEQVMEAPVEKKGRWKSVLETSGKETGGFTNAPLNSPNEKDEDVGRKDMDEDIDGEPIEDVDGEPMEEDVDGEPMEDEDVDGVPMEEEVEQESPKPASPAPNPEPEKPVEAPRPLKRQRMRAADMFTEN